MIEIVRSTAQILAQLAFRERAELAAEIADVRVVDIAIDDVADAVAGHRRAKPVRRLADPPEILPARREEPDDFVLEEFVPRARALDDGLNRRSRTSQSRSAPIRRWRGGGAGHPRIRASESVGIDAAQDLSAHGRIEPPARFLRIARIDRQALDQQFSR